MARRSARLSKAQADLNKPLPKQPQLGSVLERDESPDEEQQLGSIEDVMQQSTGSKKNQQLEKMSKLSTPKTEPRPSRSEMHPKTAHGASTVLNSGQKLGFSDISSKPRQSTGSAQNTPSRSVNKSNQSPGFNFTFASESVLSHEAQKMMDTVREDAARIKAEMKAQKDLQDQKDGEAEKMYNPYGRKLAQPKAKAGRYSDIHMAQFKKMDSIANHPSSFRARPGYAQPTAAQSLKRSPSKAGLDEPERPQTAGAGATGRVRPNSSSARTISRGPYDTLPPPPKTSSPAKHARRSENEDVSSHRQGEEIAIKTQTTMKPSGIPKSTSNLFSPTKASLARASQSASPVKQSMLPRSQTTRGVRDTARKSLGRFTSKLLAIKQDSQKDSPVIRKAASTATLFAGPLQSQTPSVNPSTASTSFSSRLPTFSGLKSILRSPQKASAERESTPKRPNTSAGITETIKRVDFTPSVKSRYAVKLTNNSPAPGKPAQDANAERVSQPRLFDPAAYVIPDEQDDAWEDIASSPVEYPALPALPSDTRPLPFSYTGEKKAEELPRPGSKNFKSIFTDLHPNRSTGPQAPAPSTNIATKPPNDTCARPSRPSTIRRVRSSGSIPGVEPFADTQVQTMAHGLPAKKRRRESMYFDTQENAQEASKENRPVPGAWDDGEESEDEGAKRTKRVKTFDFPDVENDGKQAIVSPKKKSAAREAAARSARDRKSMAPGQSKGTPGRGLSMSRLNMLSQPKNRV